MEVWRIRHGALPVTDPGTALGLIMSICLHATAPLPYTRQASGVRAEDAGMEAVEGASVG